MDLATPQATPLSIKKQLIEIVASPVKIKKLNLNSDFMDTLEKCRKVCFQFEKCSIDKSYEKLLFEIDSVLDYLHEELNTGHWSNVPVEIRQNFTVASFLKCLIILESKTKISVDTLQECLKSLDLGLLLGATLEENQELLTESARHLRVHLNYLESAIPFTHKNTVSTKRKIGEDDLISQFKDLDGIAVCELEMPSIETFSNQYFLPQIPLKLKGCMDHWPATTKWLDLNYLLKIAGDRTVPVEIGSHYTNEDWSQKLMTVKEFISKHYLSDTGDIGYLAQHNLFDQISELKEDIRIPEYCCCSLNYEESTEPDINAWLGPKGTVSPLHQDPKNNILAQVYGTKQILLFSPNHSSYLYPHGEKMLSNTAQVDPINPDFSRYPEFSKAKMYKCLLEPGEMLFIPVKWWHHVTALDKSFSVSFWWQ